MDGFSEWHFLEKIRSRPSAKVKQGLPEEVAYLRCGVKERLRFLSQRYCGLPNLVSPDKNVKTTLQEELTITIDDVYESNPDLQRFGKSFHDSPR